MMPCHPTVRTEPRSRYLTEAEQQRIIDLFRSLVAAGQKPTVKAIAAQVDRSGPTVAAWLRAAGLRQPNPKFRRTTPDERERIIALYQGTSDGPLSLGKVARMVGRTVPTVNKVITDAGVKRPRHSVTVISVYRWTGDRYQKLTDPTGLDEGDVVVKQWSRNRLAVHQVPADPGPDVRPPAEARSAGCLRSGCLYGCAVTCAQRQDSHRIAS